ncbi:MAG: hypothetical protein H6502_02050 [Candidatus Woesearchaeota archaeon]|nr:MAG: hypothetical protein H6502_02050 [Candidatus Woesearchaeota archaeon]
MATQQELANWVIFLIGAGLIIALVFLVIIPYFFAVSEEESCQLHSSLVGFFDPEGSFVKQLALTAIDDNLVLASSCYAKVFDLRENGNHLEAVRLNPHKSLLSKTPTLVEEKVADLYSLRDVYGFVSRVQLACIDQINNGDLWYETKFSNRDDFVCHVCAKIAYEGSFPETTTYEEFIAVNQYQGSDVLSYLLAFSDANCKALPGAACRSNVLDPLKNNKLFIPRSPHTTISYDPLFTAGENYYVIMFRYNKDKGQTASMATAVLSDNERLKLGCTYA